MAPEYACMGELAEFVAYHIFGDIDRDKFMAIVNGDGMPDEFRRDSTAARPGLDNFLSPCSFIVSILARSFWSTNGPFFSDLVIYFLRYFRRLTMDLLELLRFFLVLYPLHGCPHGVTACLYPLTRPSPPPCGWS